MLSTVYSYIYSFNKNVLPGTVLGTGANSDQSRLNLCLHGTYILVRETNSKQINKYNSGSGRYLNRYFNVFNSSKYSKSAFFLQVTRSGVISQILP